MVPTPSPPPPKARQISTEWVTLLAGPLVWTVYFLVGYTAAEFGCRGLWLSGQIGGLQAIRVVVLVLTVLALAVSAWLFWRTWRRWRALRPDPDAALTRAEERQRFMVLGGLLLGGLFTLAIVLTGIPALILEGC
jgi:heme/copper-type cytochrome/quinol oxidase subunit 2